MLYSPAESPVPERTMRNPKAMTLQQALESRVANIYGPARTIATFWEGDENVTVGELSEHPDKLVRGSAYMILHEATMREIEDSQRPIPFSVEYSRCSHILLEKPRSLV